MVDRNAVFEAANDLHSEGALVSQSTVRARLTRKTGRGGSPRDVGPYLLEWKAEKTYAPVPPRGTVPADVSAYLARATATLWAAAQDEADRAFQGDRERFETTLRDERALRAETLAMADGLLVRVAGLEAELAEARRHIQAVRADHFWDRVVHDIHAILPADGSMRVREIADRLGADLAEEARTHVEEWSLKTIRKKIEQRIFHKRLFARSAPGLYRRRRPEDNVLSDARRMSEGGAPSDTL
ncbi:DNA-binding protein [Methylobacterium sp. Leaf100]|uniref:DNA-binding protein n=1 Tax=Methylobacterium sp. Leaf100 TaxID=1736252 RepID=UPI000700B39D|nr:DNA-binding protein [Methylobacterium sp. Leaf100]KQP32869.1 hypothetical protein ASF25_17825 [Methylobacterium sp. Leaf100]